MEGFILLHKKMLDWEWYQDSNTKNVFLHLLLKANFKAVHFMGKEVKRGQLITTTAKIALETGLSSSQVRTALRRLHATGEIEMETTNKFTLITITRYGLYQDKIIPTPINGLSANKIQSNDKQKTNKTQTNNKQMTNKRQTNNNQMTRIEEINKINKSPLAPQKEEGVVGLENYGFQEPLLEAVKEWIRYKGEKRQSYKPQGLRQLMKRIGAYAAQYGQQPVIQAIQEAMANNWQGIVWAKISKGDTACGGSVDNGEGPVGFVGLSGEELERRRKLLEG